MTVILSGGGSGGHITPILAVAKSIKKQAPDTSIIYIGQVGDHFSDIPKQSKYVDYVYAVRAGKFRRYHGEGLKQLLNIKTFLLNCRDFIYLCIGIMQSGRLMKRLKPDVLFTRGGFVSVPVAVAAKFKKVPYFTHDSDSVPSLANRLISRWAYKNLVSMDESIYPYPRHKTIRTGIPVSDKFKPVSKADKQAYKIKLQIDPNGQLLFVIGGGLGSRNINNAVISIANDILNSNKKLYIAHVAGRQNTAEVEDKYKDNLDSANLSRVKVLDFIDNVDEYSGAADVIIARAGATTIAEFAIQGKACIIIPSSVLVGGHQLKNAQELAKSGAAVIVDENELEKSPASFKQGVESLLKSQDQQSDLSKNISKYAKPDSSDEIAKIILSVANKHET